MLVTHIFICPEKIYSGRFGQRAGTAPMVEVNRVQAVPGRGLVGDRYCDRPPGHKGQVTFFSEETWERLCGKFAIFDRGPGVFRRNVVVTGADLNALVGVEFELQGVRFEGSEYCKPCFWMDHAFAPGTLAALAAWCAGGLRARILTGGWLSPAASRRPAEATTDRCEA